jgi:hypothetical protein
VASVAGTKLAVRAGNKVIVASGLLLFAAGLLWTATVSASTSYTTIALQMEDHRVCRVADPTTLIRSNR